MTSFKIIVNDSKLNWNHSNPKPFVIIFCFRLTSYLALHRFKILKYLSYPIRIMYRLLIEWFLGVEIPDTTKVGHSLIIHHGIGLVLNADVIIGDNVILRNNTTIGHKTDRFGKSLGSPTIGNHVNIGANVVIIGNIYIGDHAIIGAGTVVVKDVPSRAVVVGNPAKIIKYI